MIQTPTIPVPRGFRTHVAKKGNAWLKRHPAAKSSEYPDLWRTAGGGKYVDALREGSNWLCAYTAHRVEIGTVDHFLSKEGNPKRTYDWSNYRLAQGWMNSAKQPAWDGKLLDPRLVRAGWFKVLLPSMLLVVDESAMQAAGVQDSVIALAKSTLATMPIHKDRRVTKFRERAYEHFIRRRADSHAVALDCLRDEAPLVAAAVEMWLAGQPVRPLPPPVTKKFTK